MLSKTPQSETLKRKKGTQQNIRTSGECQKTAAFVNTQCFLYIASPSTQPKKNIIEPLFSSDDETNDMMLDEEDERAVEEAEHLEDLRKDILRSHS